MQIQDVFVLHNWKNPSLMAILEERERTAELLMFSFDGNKITNISNSSSNTTVVGDWMDRFESKKNFHKIKVSYVFSTRF